LPNEKHEFSTGWRAALKGVPAGCTIGRASGLHIKAGCTVSWAAEKDGLEACPFLQPVPPFSAARWNTFLCSLQARPSVQPAESSRFSFGNTARHPSN